MKMNGEVDWTYDFPQYWLSDTIGSIGIAEMTISTSGDVILAGVRRRTHGLGSGNDIYLAKMTVDGQVVWEHFYNTPIDSSSQEYSYYYVQDVQELADKSILVMGGSFQHDQIVILRVDSAGCLNGYDCSRREILLHEGASSRVENNNATVEAKFKPNPTTGTVTIELPEICSGQCWIYNTSGAVIESFMFSQQAELNVDLSNESTGMFFFKISTNRYLFTGKVLKY
jgi:hypothetical protein